LPGLTGVTTLITHEEIVELGKNTGFLKQYWAILTQRLCCLFLLCRFIRVVTMMPSKLRENWNFWIFLPHLMGYVANG